MLENEKETPSFFSVLTANVRYDKRLSASEKIFYSEITALCNIKGYCSASNNYFTSLYDVSIRTISSWLTKLSNYNYIKVEYDKNNYRKIFIVLDMKVDSSKLNKIKSILPREQKPKNDILKKFIDSIV